MENFYSFIIVFLTLRTLNITLIFIICAKAVRKIINFSS